MTDIRRNKTYFVTWIIEYYKNKFNMDGAEVCELFNKKGINEWLYENFEVLHSANEEYVMSEIQEMMQKQSDR